MAKRKHTYERAKRKRRAAQRAKRADAMPMEQATETVEAKAPRRAKVEQA